MFAAMRWSGAAGVALVAAAMYSDGQELRAPAEIRTVLERQTQELFDAIAAGNREPWQRYLHEDVVVTAEDGKIHRKAALVADLTPFPKDIWGKLRVTEFQTIHHGPVIIANYVADEEQGYFGQVLHARYRVTDTWLETRGGWRLIASQVLALRDDPPAITLPASRLDEYVGVYALTSDVTYTISRSDGGLTGQRTGRTPDKLLVEVPDSLFVPGQPRLRKVFQRNAEGRITGFVERRESWSIAWRRVK